MPSVLIVDDNRRSSALLARELEALGCAVVGARDGAEALRTLAQVDFDAMLIEIILPGMDGFEAIVEARRRWPRCRIVAMSDGGRFLTPAEALDIARLLGVHASLKKPFSTDELRAALAPVLGAEAA